MDLSFRTGPGPSAVRVGDILEKDLSSLFSRLSPGLRVYYHTSYRSMIDLLTYKLLQHNVTCSLSANKQHQSFPNTQHKGIFTACTQTVCCDKCDLLLHTGITST